MKTKGLVDDLRAEIGKKNQTIHRITHRNGRFLDMVTHEDYIELNIKLEGKVKAQLSEIESLGQQNAKLENQKNDVEYQLKMMEFYSEQNMIEMS